MPISIATIDYYISTEKMKNNLGRVWFAVLTAIEDISGSAFNSAFTELIQANIDSRALGRIVSLSMTTSLIHGMLGLIGIGFLADGLRLSNIIHSAQSRDHPDRHRSPPHSARHTT